MEKYKLNIAIVVAEFPTVSETFIVNQIVYLIENGHNVTILSFLKPKDGLIHDIVKKYELQKLCVYYLKPDKNILKRYLNYLKWLFKTKDLNYLKVLKSFNVFKSPKDVLNLSAPYLAQWFVTNKKFDLIHVHFAPNAIGIAEMIDKRLINNSKLIVSFHGYDIVPKLIEDYKKKYYYLIKNSHSFIANSEYTKGLVDKLGIPNKTKVIPVSLDTSIFCKTKNKSENDSKFRILFCGRLIKLKGPELLIEIIDELVNIGKQTNIELLVIGDGECLPILETKIDDFKLNDFIKLLGNKRQEEIKDLMEISDVLIQPGITDPYSGREETQGLVIQEAQSMQLPVIVSDVGGMKYGLIDGVTGFVVKQKNVSEFVEKLTFFIQNPEITKEMGIKGRQFVVENFDSEILGKKLLNLYNS